MSCAALLLLLPGAPSAAGLPQERVQVRVLESGKGGLDLHELPSFGLGRPLAELERELSALYLQLSPSLVEVRSRIADGDGQREIITAGLVISADGYVVAPVYRPSADRDLPSISVRRVDGEEFAGEWIASNAAYGLSLVKVPELRGMQPRLFPGLYLMEGAPVLALGNAFGLESSMSFGILTGKGRQAGEARELLQVTNPIHPGDGGGLLADARGNVVGVLLSSLPDLARAGVPIGVGDQLLHEVDEESARRAGNVGFAVPVEVVIGLFPEQLGGLMKRSRMLGVEVERKLTVVETPDEPTRSWALMVRSVLPGSAAAAAGLRAGDLFISLAGMPVVTLEDLGVAIFTAPERSVLSVRRGAVDLTLEVDFRVHPLAPPPSAPKPEPDQD